ncbi:hypothetical protein [Rhodococcus ruber]|uniref:hypothetical protein n=1 Tax=Rhodococcus ruber TaxID=1830 RepID=UPI003783740B
MTDTHAHVLAARVIASGPWNTPADLAHHVVDTLLADGYRRTWTVTTVDELAALPPMTVVLVHGIAWQRAEAKWGPLWYSPELEPCSQYELIDHATGYQGEPRTITVIHTPEH